MSITNGIPGAPVTISDGGNGWYVNSIDCTSANYCVAVGENNTEQGIVTTLVNGAIGTTQIVPATVNLYGVGCDSQGNCILTGASTPGSNGYSVGTVTSLVNGTLQNTRTVRGTNGFGQTVCGSGTLTAASPSEPRIDSDREVALAQECEVSERNGAANAAPPM